MKRNQITTKLCKNLKSNKNIIIFFTNCDNISIAFFKKKKESWKEGPTNVKIQMDSSPFVPTSQTHTEGHSFRQTNINYYQRDYVQLYYYYNNI